MMCAEISRMAWNGATKTKHVTISGEAINKQTSRYLYLANTHKPSWIAPSSPSMLSADKKNFMYKMNKLS